MPDYLALLGRVNVGGNRVTMARLRDIVEDLGHTRVATFIQTGNVFFTSPEEDADVLATQLGGHLTERLGFTVPTFVRTTKELAGILAADPFKDVEVGDDVRLLVVALSAELPAGVDFPVIDTSRGFTLLGVHGRQALVVLRLVDGRPGNVVAWLEKRYGVSATARFAHTLATMLVAAPTRTQP